jgi:hypothetical protein
MPPRDQTHRVYLSFQFAMDGSASFWRPTSRLPYPSKLHFASSDKLIELVERAGGFIDQETQLMVDQGVEMGRGGLFLQLTEEQYAKLTMR